MFLGDESLLVIFKGPCERNSHIRVVLREGFSSGSFMS